MVGTSLLQEWESEKLFFQLCMQGNYSYKERFHLESMLPSDLWLCKREKAHSSGCPKGSAKRKNQGTQQWHSAGDQGKALERAGDSSAERKAGSGASGHTKAALLWLSTILQSFLLHHIFPGSYWFLLNLLDQLVRPPREHHVETTHHDYYCSLYTVETTYVE